MSNVELLLLTVFKFFSYIFKFVVLLFSLTWKTSKIYGTKTYCALHTGEEKIKRRGMEVSNSSKDNLVSGVSMKERE